MWLCDIAHIMKQIFFQERHVGDLGNIEANAEGIAIGEISSSLIMLYVL